MRVTRMTANPSCRPETRIEGHEVKPVSVLVSVRFGIACSSMQRSAGSQRVTAESFRVAVACASVR